MHWQPERKKRSKTFFGKLNFTKKFFYFSWGQENDHLVKLSTVFAVFLLLLFHASLSSLFVRSDEIRTVAFPSRRLPLVVFVSLLTWKISPLHLCQNSIPSRGAFLSTIQCLLKTAGAFQTKINVKQGNIQAKTDSEGSEFVGSSLFLRSFDS